MVTEKIDGPQERITPGYVLTPAQLKSRRMRNIAIGLAIGAVVLLFYVMTIAKLGGQGVLSSPMGDQP